MIRVVEVVLPDKRKCGEHGGAPLNRVLGLRQPVKDAPRLVEQVLAHDVDRAAADEVLGADPVVAADLEIEQLAAPLGGSLPIARLPVHDRPGADLQRMMVALEQPLDLRTSG